MTLKLFIVNDFDRPNHQHITVLKDDGLLYYIHPDLEKWKGMSVTTATPLSDFGISWVIEGETITGNLTSNSTATYRDGRPRNWQGYTPFLFVMNKHGQEALRAGDSV